MSDARRPGPTREQLRELKTLRAYEMATEKLVAPTRSAEMSDDLLQVIKATFALDGNPTLGVAIHEIERLCAEIAEAKASQNGDDEEREKLHEKIADLRAEVERLKAREITDEQIDALWELMWRNPEQGYRALKLIRIVECSECEGSGLTIPEWGDSIYDNECPVCHGHKWIREERRDE